jgi:hypothetical protein
MLVNQNFDQLSQSYRIGFYEDLKRRNKQFMARSALSKPAPICFPARRRRGKKACVDPALQEPISQYATVY